MTRELLTAREAATALGVSYPALKQWIYHRKIRSIQTPGGHHRIPRSEIERLTRTRVAVRRSRDAVQLSAISGRNKLEGVVTAVQYDGLLAQVTLDIGGQFITAIITANACRDLELRKGRRAFALVKSTEVMIIRG
ncbi:MAG TPA: TOBE domain-containing protein [Terriglobia bacterium]|nr:TOBE domain-containing protein [Terriglobia bacterium]